MLSQVNATGTFRLHSNNVVAAQADVIDLTLEDLPPLDSQPLTELKATWQKQRDTPCML